MTRHRRKRKAREAKGRAKVHTPMPKEQLPPTGPILSDEWLVLQSENVEHKSASGCCVQ